MKDFYLLKLLILLFFSHFVYSSSCENSFIDTAAQDVQRIYADLQSKNAETQIKALYAIRDVRLDIETINQLIKPFLQSKNSRIRFAALQVIGDSINIFPQAIGILLSHSKQESSRFLKKWLVKTTQHIPLHEKQAFYRGRKIAEIIVQFNTHLTNINSWFRSVLGIKDALTPLIIIETALNKQEKDRDSIEQTSVELYEKTTFLTTHLRQLLLSLPYKTYMEFMHSLHYYIKYTEPLKMNMELNILIQLFYEELASSSSGNNRPNSAF